MRILLSAYACEPNKGSEPGIGWNWALEAAKYNHEIWVLTRANNKQTIEAYFQSHSKPGRLNFIYYDLPVWLRWWKRGESLIHLYYLFWQFGAYARARQLERQVDFESVHHITFGVLRQPSFMGRLGLPFVFGPGGGGERTPQALRKSYSGKGQLLDWLRDVTNYLTRFDPFLRDTFRRATIIYIRSPDSLHLIPRQYRHKVRYHIEMGVDPSTFHPPDGMMAPRAENSPIKLLFVGRLVYWKGMHLGLRAYARLIRNGLNASLTMVGEGPEEQPLRKLADKLGIRNRIEWVPWIEQATLPALYRDHDLFLFPSLHDSSPAVLLEAMSSGLPVVCLKLGGPGIMVTREAGLAIETRGRTESEVVDALVEGLSDLIQDRTLRNRLSRGALAHSKSYHWSERVAEIYGAQGSIHVLPNGRAPSSDKKDPTSFNS